MFLVGWEGQLAGGVGAPAAPAAPSSGAVHMHMLTHMAPAGMHHLPLASPAQQEASS